MTWRGVIPAAAVIVLCACPGDGTFEMEPPVSEVPTAPRALYEYLEAGTYQEFDHETAPHEPAGPHLDNVQVYLNPTLVASLNAGNDQHPRGSAAVKELYDTQGALVGWAVMVKQRDAAEGTAWYWYETHRGPTKADSPDYMGDGSSPCVPCHSAGRGFIRIVFPLR